MLEVSFSEEKGFCTLSDLSGDKAPGPDDFSMALWRFSWDFLNEKVMGFLKDFHERGWICEEY